MLVMVDKVVTRLDTLKHQQVVRGCDMCRGESQRLRTGAAKMGLLGRRAVFAAFAVLAAGPALADSAARPAAPVTTAPPAAAAATAAPKATVVTTPAPSLSPFAFKLAAAISVLPEGATEPERKDRAAIDAFYGARRGEPVWLAGEALSPKAKALIEAIGGADAYGLAAADFKLPADGAALATPEAQAATELQLTAAALAYARFARGGRIAEPITQLTANLDRRPQWIEPKLVLEGLAAAPDAGAYLTGLNPRHEQFERLRKLYVAELSKAKHGKLTKQAEHLRANMEMWRWLPDDMGTQTGVPGKGMYVFNNVPEFMQYVYKDGEIVRAERIVVGMLDKQSAIFSRPLKYVVLRPEWHVPDSIKVNELWPGLIKHTRVMSAFGIEVKKDGERVDWHKVDWANADINAYEFVQPPGPRSVLGHVKFSFPSQHTIYMHDTPDKFMFNSAVRTLSHGCLRVRNPMALAEMILAEDKGWDADKIAELNKSGPLNNEVPLDKRIPIHVAYYTAWVDGDGGLKNFPDIYGHEKRVTQALNGQWDKIDHGKDDQAPVEANFDPRALAARAKGGDVTAADNAADPFGGSGKRGRAGKGQKGGLGDLLSALFGG